MNAIYIDTSDNKKVIVSLKVQGEEDRVEQDIGPQKSQVVLPLIEELLKKHNLTIRDITHIEVNQGPGSFTGLRVGVSIANALSYSLQIPVNNKPVREIVEPVYE